LVEHSLEVLDDLGGCLEPLDELRDEVLGLLVDLWLVLGGLELASFDLLLAAYYVDVVDGVNDLPNLLLVLVVSVNLVLEILLKRRVFLMDALQLHLQILHLTLLVIQCVL
jgi:hypothetical protein